MVNGVDEKGAILSHPTARRSSERLGREVIAELAKRLEE
jgi:hypothetical protein